MLANSTTLDIVSSYGSITQTPVEDDVASSVYQFVAGILNVRTCATWRHDAAPDEFRLKMISSYSPPLREWDPDTAKSEFHELFDLLSTLPIVYFPNLYDFFSHMLVTDFLPSVTAPLDPDLITFLLSTARDDKSTDELNRGIEAYSLLRETSKAMDVVVADQQQRVTDREAELGTSLVGGLW